MADDQVSEMQRCVDAEDIDGLLGIVSADEIAIAWHRYQDDASVGDAEPPDWWAVALFLTREIFQRPDLYRSLVLKLVEHAPEDRLGHVGAGPLENYVSDDEDDLAWLEQACRTNARLRTALANVWCAGAVSEHTLARLDAAAGAPLSRR